MPNSNDNSHQDGEDILELTEVVAPPPQQPAVDTQTPGKNARIGADFGADLDALLDSLGPASAASAAAQQPQAAPRAFAQSSPQRPVPVSIADQSPVDHVVDPNEELAMPEMADIDSLLAELGAEPPVPAAEKKESVLPAPSEVDGLLAELGVEGPLSTAPKGRPALDDLPEDLAAMIASGAQDTQQTKAPSQPAIPSQPVVPSQTVPEAVAAPLAGTGGDIDLTELDALLDDMLAAAPSNGSRPLAENAVSSSGGGAQPSAEPVSLLQSAPETSPVTTSRELQATRSWEDKLQETADALGARLDAVAASFETRFTELESSLGPRFDTANSSFESRLGGSLNTLSGRLDLLETAVEGLRQQVGTPAEPQKPGLTETDVEGIVARMLTPESSLAQAISASVAVSVTSRLQDMFAGAAPLDVDPHLQECLTAFHKNLDKMITAAAAKVIREVIVSMENEQGA